MCAFSFAKHKIKQGKLLCYLAILSIINVGKISELYENGVKHYCHDGKQGTINGSLWYSCDRDI